MTPFTKIYDYAIITIADYKMTNLIKTDEDAFYTYMRSLLMVGIPEFVDCFNSLDYTSQEETDLNDGEVHVVYYFTQDLSVKEISILSKWVIIKWFEQQIQDITAFEGLPTRDFNKIKSDSFFKQKSEYRDKLLEDVNKAMTDYEMQNYDNLPFFGGA